MEIETMGDILVFTKVVELNSFTATGKELRKAKSVISKAIKRLEDTLGVQLLQRSTRRIALTEHGKLFYERCKYMTDNFNEACELMQIKQELPLGTLRIASPSGFASQHLVPAIHAFMQDHPQIKIELLLGQAYEDLFEHSIDIGIRLGQLADSSLKARKLTTRGLRVCASPKYLKKHGSPKHPDDLKNHRCLLYVNSPTGNEWHFHHDHKKIRVRLQSNFMANSSSSLISAALDDMGLIMLPGYLLTQYLKKGDLVSLLDDYCKKDINIYALYNYEKHVPPKIRLFLDFIAERFNNNVYWGKDA